MVDLVVFAMAEVILFSWIFGMDRGWKELNEGADIRVPHIYRFIIKYITPVMLIAVFLGALLTPVGNEWTAAFSSLFNGDGWSLDNGSIIRQIANTGLREQIAAAQGTPELAALKDRLFYTNMARGILLTAFLGLASLVYLSGVRRLKNQRPV